MSAGRIESELKYWADADAPLEALAEAPLLGPAELGAARSVEETDRYLDTADLRLAAAGWACRIRQREGTMRISLKGRAEHAAGDPLHRRAELEGPAGAVLDPAEWPSSAARDLVCQLAGAGALVERFTLAQHRIERPVSERGVSVGLLSLDRCRVVHRGRLIGALRVVELELEVVGGPDPGPFAEALGALPGLVPDPLSKLERALALIASS